MLAAVPGEVEEPATIEIVAGQVPPTAVPIYAKYVLPLLTGLFNGRADCSSVPIPYWFIILGFALAAIVYYKHRANIARIIDGTEPKISFGSAGKKQD